MYIKEALMEPNIITLTDQYGESVRFELLDIVEYEDQEFAVLYPADGGDDEPVHILRKRKQMVWMDEIPETPDVDAGFENSEWKEALNSLSENFRLVVMLYYIEGFKTSEISQILDIPEGTVRSRLARGREQLAGLFQVKVVN